MASASSMPPKTRDLKSLLECSICLETFDNPRTLLCLHSFCKKCLENFVDGKHDDQLNCPVCRCKFTLSEKGVAGMTRNHFICSMVEVLSIQHQDSIPCSHCEQPSVGRCVTCELFMCEKCFKPHNDYHGFHDHVVFSMKELSKPENQSKIKTISKCSKHPRKKLKYYCETCDELICRHCMDFDHNKQHKFSPLEQAAQSKLKDLQKNCEILERTVADSNKETRVLKEDIKSLNNDFVKAQRLINERKKQLLAKLNNIVDKKTNSMIENARQVFDDKTENIEEEIHENEAFLNRVKASADMARSLLENGNDEEIIRSYQSVQENVNNTVGKRNKKLCIEDDAVLSWSSDEIDAILLAEIKDIVADKDELGEKQNNSQTAVQQRVEAKASCETKHATTSKNMAFSNTFSYSAATQGKGRSTQGNVPPPTSGFSSLWKVWDSSPLSGTAQGRGRSTQGNMPPPTSSISSLWEVWDSCSLSGRAQGSRRGTQNFPQHITTSKTRREARSQAEAFVAHVYENDYREIQKLVQQYPNIQTGGDLFGLWKDERTVIIQQFIGPGKRCERTPTSFYQDIEYLRKLGSLITTEEGLCNVGEWHSHHQRGMPEPSEADCRTVFNNMPHLGLERFMLFIASIESTGSSGKKRPHEVKSEDVKLRPFLYIGSTEDIVKGKIEIIYGENPHRLNSRARKEIEAGAEPPRL